MVGSSLSAPAQAITAATSSAKVDMPAAEQYEVVLVDA
jgi:hypothetical protein